MLSISPKVDKFLSERCGAPDAKILLCSEDGVEKGYIAFTQNGYIIEIVGFEVYFCDKLEGESLIIADTLIKALGSYAMNHSCFYIECSKKELYTMLEKFSFSLKENKMTVTLAQLFKVCKN